MALLGGIHCVAMCGGIAIVAEQNHTQETVIGVYRNRRQPWVDLCVMHLGRITTYMTLGAILGAVGASVWRQDYLPLHRWLFGAGSVLLLASGVSLLRGRAFSMDWAERLVALLANRIVVLQRLVTGRSPNAARPISRSRSWSTARRFSMGLAWGMVPCGMVYGALAVALLAGNAWSGALVMAAFGLGTMPNLLVISGLSARLRLLARKPASRTVLALAVIGFGAVGVLRAVWLPETLAQHGFCMVF